MLTASATSRFEYTIFASVRPRFTYTVPPDVLAGTCLSRSRDSALTAWLPLLCRLLVGSRGSLRRDQHRFSRTILSPTSAMLAVLPIPTA